MGTAVERASPPTRGLSVVVPSHHGRVPLVRRLLDSLSEALPAAGEPSEVIVVDDRDTPEMRRVCGEHGARLLIGPARAGAKRNVGWRAARHDVVLFIDSDCVADTALAEEVLRTMRANDASMGAVVGLTAMAGSEPFHWRVARYSRYYNQPFVFALCFERVLWGPTANLACRRSALESVGGFDERTPTLVGGEDVDLGVRLNQAGHRIVSNPRAVVWHGRDHVRSLRPILRSVFTYGRAETYLLLRHPARGRWRPVPGIVAGGVLVVAASQLPVLPAAVRIAGALVAVAGLAVLGRRLRREVAATAPVDEGPDAGADDRGASDPERSCAYRARLIATASAMDRLNLLGRAFEALRQGRPWLALRRFDLLGRETAVWSSPPPLPVAREPELP